MLVASQKIKVQREFKAAFGIEPWKLRSGGGTWMDGRCSRLAFSNPEIFSKICGIPEDLIKDFDLLVTALVSGVDINPDEFDKKAQFWLDRFHGNANISWNVLCPTVNSFPFF